MLPPRTSDDAAARHLDQFLRIRGDLAGLCQRIADVENGVADTFDEIASTASPERARRLSALACAARNRAIEEQARAEIYSSS